MPVNHFDPPTYYPGYYYFRSDTALFGPGAQRSNAVINDLISLDSITYTAPGYSLTANASLILYGGIIATPANAPNLAANFAVYLGANSTVRNLTGSGSIQSQPGQSTLTVVGPGGDFTGMLSDTGGSAGPQLALTLGDGVSAASLTLHPDPSWYPQASSAYTGTTLVNPNATLVNGAGGALAPSSAHVINGTLTLATGSAAVGALSGAGTVNLGANTLTVNNGGAFSGTATGAGRLKVTGGRLLLDGASVSNAIQLAGGSLARNLPASANLAGALNVISADGPEQTGATILSGTTTAATTLEVGFTATPAFTATNDSGRISDVLSLEGTGTETFALQLAVDGVTASSFLGWFDADTGQWANAVAGNTGGDPLFVQGAWQAGYGLGTYGVDTANNTVWAVINHNSEFAVVVPEPAVSVFIFTALGGLAVFRRQRRAG